MGNLFRRGRVGKRSLDLEVPNTLARMVGVKGLVNAQTINATNVRLKIGTDPAVTQNVQFGPTAVPNSQGWSSLSSPALLAGTTYYSKISMTGNNGVEVLDNFSSPVKFKMPPVGQTSFSFSFAACCNSTDSAAMAAIASQTDDLFIHMGDMWYADGSGVNIGNYRSRMTEKITAPNHSSVFSSRACSYTPSDHDFSMNNNGTGLSDTTARTLFNQTYREIVPAPLEQVTTGVYYSFTWGRIRFVNMDLRSFKSNPSATDNATKTALGTVQKQWLKDLIAASTDAVIVLISETPWNGPVDAGSDAWDGYSTERSELASFFSDSGKNICLIAGDAHMVAADSGVNSPGGIAIFQAAPLNNTASIKGGPYSSGTYPASGTTRVEQYGRIVVTDSGPTVSLAFNGYSSDNTSRISMTKTYNV